MRGNFKLQVCLQMEMSRSMVLVYVGLVKCIAVLSYSREINGKLNYGKYGLLEQLLFFF